MTKVEGMLLGVESMALDGMDWSVRLAGGFPY
jgi:hypothetical protein